MLAQLLRQRMKELNITPGALAEATGLTPSAISRLLTGSRFNPEAKTVGALSIVLQLPVDAIIEAALADQQAAFADSPAPADEPIAAVA